MTALGALIEYRDVASLTAYARNARTHSAEQIADLAASMREWGWTMPVLVAEGCDGAADGEIIAGHGRVLAAAAIYADGGVLKMAGGEAIPGGAVPVIVARGWNEAQRRAYIIADNQLTLAGGWDESILRLELMDLREFGFDLSKIGFDDTALAGLLDVRLDVEADPEAAPDLPAVPVSRAGDVWSLGRHRLLCGDATCAADVARALAGAAPHLMVTDPPYGISFERGKSVGRTKRAKGPAFAPVVNDDLRGDALTELMRSAVAAWNPESGTIYSWSSALAEGYSLMKGIEAADFKVQSQIVWKKTPFVIGRADYHWQHEICWYAFKGLKNPLWIMMRANDNTPFLSRDEERVLSAIPPEYATNITKIRLAAHMPEKEAYQILERLIASHFAEACEGFQGNRLYRITAAGLKHPQRDKAARRARAPRLPAHSERIRKVLSAIWDSRTLRIKDVADVLGVPHQSINALMQYLKRKQLVKKTGQEFSAPYSLTGEGRAALAEMTRRHAA
jgi:ParB-like chromosome segregation protein Spo0J/predicted transcriptional regulator